MKTYKTKFGIEIELTGITRKETLNVINQRLNGVVDYYKETIKTEDNRVWKVAYDSSIEAKRKIDGTYRYASSEYCVELVSPILQYEDIELLQDLIRLIRKAGGYTKDSRCGIHIHLDGTDHNVQSIKNFINIIASKNDLLYKALNIAPERIRYCKKIDDNLVRKLKTRRVKTYAKLKKMWYEDYMGATETHYHQSRYHFLNLHSYFTGNHTVELRGFNSELHAGKVKAYILLALGMNEQALTQKCASSKKPQIENEKFAMRTYLNRIGFIGEENKNYRKHLCEYLEGTSAWRYGYPPKKQKEADTNEVTKEGGE